MMPGEIQALYSFSRGQERRSSEVQSSQPNHSARESYGKSPLGSLFQIDWKIGWTASSKNHDAKCNWLAVISDVSE